MKREDYDVYLQNLNRVSYTLTQFPHLPTERSVTPPTAGMPTLRRYASIDEGANFPAAPPLPAKSEAAGEAVRSVPAAPIKKEDSDTPIDDGGGVNFPPSAAPPLPAEEGEAGEAFRHMSSTAPIKNEDYDASTDEEVNFHAPRPSRDREKRRRMDDGDGVDGASNHDGADGGENGKSSPDRECVNDEGSQGGYGGEYPSSANGGMIRAGGGVDDAQHTGQQGGGAQQSSTEGVPDESDTDSVDHVLREDYDIFDGNISFCCQNCR